MAKHFDDNFDSGSNGTVISSSNSLVTSSFGSPIFSNTHAHSGSLSARFQTSSSTQFLAYDSIPGSVLYVRFYFWMDALPGANTYICSGLGGGAVRRLDMRVNTSGAVAIRNLNTAVATSTTNLTTGAWHRIEWRIDNTASQQQLRLFVGANVEGTTPDYDSGNVSYTQATDIDSLHPGLITSSTWTVYLDDFAASPDGWIGPLSSGTAHTQTITDPAGHLDTQGFVRNIAQTFTNLAGHTETLSLNASGAKTQAQNDGQGLTDGSPVLGWGGSVTDPVDVTDSVTADVSGMVRQDSQGLTDGSPIYGLGGFTEDPIDFRDAVSYSLTTSNNLVVNVTEDLGLTEPGSSFTEWGVLDDENAVSTDGITAPKSVAKTDPVGVTDVNVSIEHTLGEGELYQRTFTDEIVPRDLISQDHVVPQAYSLTINDRATAGSVTDLIFLAVQAAAITTENAVQLTDSVLVDLNDTAEAHTLTVQDDVATTDDLGASYVIHILIHPVIKVRSQYVARHNPYPSWDQALSVWKIDGQWHSGQMPDPDFPATCEHFFRGGYRAEIADPAVLDELISAGYNFHTEEIGIP